MRIRNIKPAFWRSDDIVSKDWHVRLVFIGLWSYVDDNGVGIDKLSDITADLFAHDLSIDPIETLNRVSTALDVLHKAGLIQRYAAGGKRYIFVSRWDSHQKVTNPNKPRFPRPDESLTSGYIEPTETLNSSSVETTETLPTGVEVHRYIGAEGEREKTSSAELTQAAKYPPDFEAFWSHYPRKVGKDAALKAWLRARRRVPVEKLCASAARMAADPNLPEQQYIPHASKWLNDGRWDDPPYPPRTSGRTPTADQHVINGLDLAQRLNAEEGGPAAYHRTEIEA